MAVNTTPLVDGALATVFSVGAPFTLVKSPTAELIAAADGITVVQSTATPGTYWVRGTTLSIERFGANPPLFLDPVGGSDDNDGFLIGTPIKSLPEWCRRTAGATFTASFTLTCAAGDAGPFTPTFLMDGAAVVVTIQGNVTTSAVGTIGAFVAQNENAAANVDGIRSEFTDAPGPVIAQKDRLRITASGTGSHVGLVAFVTSLHTSAHNPYTTRWAVLGVGAADPVVIDPSNGDSYVIDTLNTKMGVIGVNTVTLGASGVLRIMDFEVLAPGASGVAHTLIGNLLPSVVSGARIQRCKFTDAALTSFYNSICRLSLCDFRSVTFWSTSHIEHYDCIFWANHSSTDSVSVFRQETTWAASGGGSTLFTLTQSSEIYNFGTIGWCNSVGGRGFSLNRNSFFSSNGPLWGAGNSFAIGLELLSGCFGIYSSAAFINIPGTVPIQIGGFNYVQTDLPVSGSFEAGLVLGI